MVLCVYCKYENEYIITLSFSLILGCLVLLIFAFIATRLIPETR